MQPGKSRDQESARTPWRRNLNLHQTYLSPRHCIRRSSKILFDWVVDRYVFARSSHCAFSIWWAWQSAIQGPCPNGCLASERPKAVSSMFCVIKRSVCNQVTWNSTYPKFRALPKCFAHWRELEDVDATIGVTVADYNFVSVKVAWIQDGELVHDSARFFQKVADMLTNTIAWWAQLEGSWLDSKVQSWTAPRTAARDHLIEKMRIWVKAPKES